MSITQRSVNLPSRSNKSVFVVVGFLLVLATIVFMGMSMATAQPTPYTPPLGCVDGNPWYGTALPSVPRNPTAPHKDPYLCTHYGPTTTTLPINPNLTNIPTTTAPIIEYITQPTPSDTVPVSVIPAPSVQAANSFPSTPLTTINVPGNDVAAPSETCTGNLSLGSYSVDCTSGPNCNDGDISSQQTVKYFNGVSSASSFENDFCGLDESGFCWAPPNMTYPGEAVQTGLNYSKETCS